ncbi:hypothetical protein MKZ38_004126 [Zalerion maritima]|uniref:Uncharacterized protein n=1 Tax=Zalerion maritima TaxID=339359 RepID=A0AAD5WRW9_9PEZI|nr:hypothetical protein MKZ38_004126 [Zalerion maritima]
MTEVGGSTCGYLTGDPSQPRAPGSGFDCRTDTARGLLGFCPAGICVDSEACSGICGSVRNTIFWPLPPPLFPCFCALRVLPASPALDSTNSSKGKTLCSTADLTDSEGGHETYNHLAYGHRATTRHRHHRRGREGSSSSPTSSTTDQPDHASATETTTAKSSDSNTSKEDEDGTDNPAAMPATSPSQPSNHNTAALVRGTLGSISLIGFLVLSSLWILRRNRNRNRNSCNEGGKKQQRHHYHHHRAATAARRQPPVPNPPGSPRRITLKPMGTIPAQTPQPSRRNQKSNSIGNNNSKHANKLDAPGPSSWR